jgi:hypothetical protein
MTPASLIRTNDVVSNRWKGSSGLRAVSPAATYGSCVEAVAVGHVSESTAYVMEGGGALANVFELEREPAIGRRSSARRVRHRGEKLPAFPARAVPVPTLMSH